MGTAAIFPAIIYIEGWPSIGQIQPLHLFVHKFYGNTAMVIVYILSMAIFMVPY